MSAQTIEAPVEVDMPSDEHQCEVTRTGGRCPRPADVEVILTCISGPERVVFRCNVCHVQAESWGILCNSHSGAHKTVTLIVRPLR